MIALSAIALACGRAAAPVVTVPAAVADAGPYRLHPGDVVEVKFPFHPSETQRVTVRPDGGIALGVTGDIPAEGRTAEEFEALVRERSARYLRDPVVNVAVVESRARVYVGGEVVNAGFVALNKPMTVLQAVLERGGFTAGADLEEVVVLSRVGGDAVARRIDVARAVRGEPLEHTGLAPDDVVFVPKTGIAAANSWMNRWIDGLTPQLLKGLRFPTF